MEKMMKKERRELQEEGLNSKNKRKSNLLELKLLQNLKTLHLLKEGKM